MRFVIKSVKDQDNFTIVSLEPLNQPLFLEDEIPPGCIQHILSNLLNNIESKDICIKMCKIIRKIHMDDDNSRNYHTFLSYISFVFLCISYISQKHSFLADSRMLFKEYDGTKLLCELFGKHRELTILNALTHVIDSRDGST